jgi:hypothetical protein
VSLHPYPRTQQPWMQQPPSVPMLPPSRAQPPPRGLERGLRAASSSRPPAVAAVRRSCSFFFFQCIVVSMVFTGPHRKPAYHHFRCMGPHRSGSNPRWDRDDGSFWIGCGLVPDFAEPMNRATFSQHFSNFD